MRNVTRMWTGVAVALVASATTIGATSGRADAAEAKTIRFPVAAASKFRDNFGDCRDDCARSHAGIDIYAPKHTPLLAAADGVISDLRPSPVTIAGVTVSVRGDDGWTYRYVHVNNDTIGTDDGNAPYDQRFGPGIVLGARVAAGQTIAYLGDSGNAEDVDAHLHFEMYAPGMRLVNAYPSLIAADFMPRGTYCRYATNPASDPSGASAAGYWVLGSDGGVFTYGDLAFHGSTGDMTLNAPAITLEATPSGRGYWFVAADGGIFSFGDAQFHGSTGDLVLNQPIVGMAVTPTGAGYWLVARDGGIFSFGDAQFYGSTGAVTLNQPIVGMAATPSGAGYCLVARDGGIFSFGDAQFHGSTGGIPLNEPIVAMAAHEHGAGYWLFARDGGVFAFGGAGFHGSVPGTGICQPAAIVGASGSATGNGYWMQGGDGIVWSFGDARRDGDPATLGVRATGFAKAVVQ